MKNKFSWKQRKAIGMYLNKRQTHDWAVGISSALEIITENGLIFITETSSASSPEYLRTE